MTYTTAEARQGLLAAVAEATDQIALALAYLGEAYEQLDDNSAERLEEELFRPAQAAYGRAKRTHAEFAERHTLPPHTFAPQSAGAASQGAKALIERAVAAASHAGQSIATLQDSMLPVEVGDAELRAGLSEVRKLLEELPSRARELVRRLGR
jgi:hypothetical protein